jgi:hypothetical protein
MRKRPMIVARGLRGRQAARRKVCSVLVLSTVRRLRGDRAGQLDQHVVAQLRDIAMATSTVSAGVGSRLSFDPPQALRASVELCSQAARGAGG